MVKRKEPPNTRHIEPPSADLIEKVLLSGDLAQLTPEQRLNYYKSVCDTLGLNPLTKPFDYIVLDNKLVLYARKDCTEQLRKRYNISLRIRSREAVEGVYTVIARASLPANKRVDEAMGAVPLEITRDGKTVPLTAIGKANAMMKAETKAKRRVTLSICGLGIMDESELETVFELPPPSEIIERNVREATAHATGEPVAQPEPEKVTEENYGEVVCHIGKAEGNILNRKVKDIHPKILQWLKEKWIPKLPEVPSDKDARLRDAVEIALSGPKDVQDEGGSKQVELANQLIERAQDLILTPDQLSRLLVRQGLMDEGQMLTDLPLVRLEYLLSSEGWSKLKEAHEAEVKPNALPDKPKPKRKTMKNDNPFQ